MNVRNETNLRPGGQRSGRKWGENARDGAPACLRGRPANTEKWKQMRERHLRGDRHGAKRRARTRDGEFVGSSPISRVLSNAAGKPAASGSHSSGRHVAVTL